MESVRKSALLYGRSQQIHLSAQNVKNMHGEGVDQPDRVYVIEADLLNVLTIKVKKVFDIITGVARFV